MKAMIRTLTLLMCCALAGAAMAAQNTYPLANPKALSAQDKDFLSQLAKGSQGEVQLGQMVASKTANQTVREFAQRMVHDHTALNQQLQQVMSKHGMNMPQGATAEDQQLQSKLQGMSGAELDRAYMKAQVQDHEKDVRTVSQMAQHADQLKVSDPDVAEVAQESLPVLKEHLELAKQIASQVGATTTAQR